MGGGNPKDSAWAAPGNKSLRSHKFQINFSLLHTFDVHRFLMVWMLPWTFVYIVFTFMFDVDYLRFTLAVFMSSIVICHTAVLFSVASTLLSIHTRDKQQHWNKQAENVFYYKRISGSWHIKRIQTLRSWTPQNRYDTNNIFLNEVFFLILVFLTHV